MANTCATHPIYSHNMTNKAPNIAPSFMTHIHGGSRYLGAHPPSAVADLRTREEARPLGVCQHSVVNRRDLTCRRSIINMTSS